MSIERKNILIGYWIVEDDITDPRSNVCICAHECE